jgi:hypothetical protein
MSNEEKLAPIGVEPDENVQVGSLEWLLRYPPEQCSEGQGLCLPHKLGASVHERPESFERPKKPKFSATGKLTLLSAKIYYAQMTAWARANRDDYQARVYDETAGRIASLIIGE